MTFKILTAIASIVLLSACSKSPAPVASTPAAQTAAEADTEEGTAASDREDPCVLLQVAEVEAVLGPLSGPPYRSNGNTDQPLARGDTCIYEGRDLRSIQMSVSRSGGSLLLKGMDVAEQVAHDTHMKGQLPKGFLPSDSTFAGEWDDLRIIGCCRMNAFLGEALIVLDFTGSKATALQAVDLVNKALLRLDKPLAIDGRAGVAPAKQRLAARMRHPTPCQLVTRAEAEAIVGKLTSDPQESESECRYRYRFGNASDEGTSDQIVHLKVEWKYGFRLFREDTTVHAAVGGDAVNAAAQTASDIGKAMQGAGNPFESLAKALNQATDKSKNKSSQDSGQTAKQTPADDYPGPWDQAAFTFPEFLAVKKNILVRVDAGWTAKIGQKFAAKAMEKL